MTVGELIRELGKVPMSEWDWPVRVETERGQDELTVNVVRLELGHVSAIYIHSTDSYKREARTKPSKALQWLPHLPRCSAVCSARGPDGQPTGRRCALPAKINGLCVNHAPREGRYPGGTEVTTKKFAKALMHCPRCGRLHPVGDDFRCVWEDLESARKRITELEAERDEFQNRIGRAFIRGVESRAVEIADLEEENALLRKALAKILIAPTGECRLCGFLDSQKGHFDYCEELAALARSSEVRP